MNVFESAAIFAAGIVSGMTAVVTMRKLRRSRRRAISVDDALLLKYGHWSIAVYEGESLFALKPADGVPNPVIGPADVTDTAALLTADPFLFRHGGKWHLFFEILRRGDERGVIARAESADGRVWSYDSVVLEEGFHLSYPQVFEWDGGIYMVPESAADFSVRLYRAVEFPNRWEHAATLLSGYPFVDPTVFRHGGRWWMLVSTDANNLLNIYHSGDLAHGWQPHPMNPVVKHDPHHARPCGPVLETDGKLYRFAQDCAPEYGVSVFAFEITELTTDTYQERIVDEKPLLTRTGEGWNSHGMHHIDAQFHDGRWIAAVDGKTIHPDTQARPATTR